MSKVRRRARSFEVLHGNCQENRRVNRSENMDNRSVESLSLDYGVLPTDI